MRRSRRKSVINAFKYVLYSFDIDEISENRLERVIARVEKEARNALSKEFDEWKSSKDSTIIVRITMFLR